MSASLRRVGRLVFVILLVPVMALTSGAGAQAATVTEWTSAKATVSFGSFKGVSAYGDVECVLSVGYEKLSSGQGPLMMQGTCTGGLDLSPGFAQPGEGGSPFRARALGVGCTEGGYGSSSLVKGDNDRLWRVQGKFEPLEVAGGGCVPTTVCIALRDNPPFGEQSEFVEGCAGITPPAGQPQSCEYGEIGAPLRSNLRITPGTADDSTWRQWIEDVTFAVEGLTGEGEWRVYSLVGPPGFDQGRGGVGGWGTGVTEPDVTSHWPNPQEIPLLGPGTVRVMTAVPTVTSGDVRISVPRSDIWRVFGEGPDFLPPDGELIGVGIFRRVAGNLFQNVRVPDATGGGFIGVTDPGACAFYWGQKLWDDGAPGEGTDEPVGPIGEPSDYDEVPPYEPVEPETPDESSWWAALWGILTQIVMAITGLAAAIISGIINGIMSLFVPSAGFFEGEANKVKDAFSDSTPGLWIDAVGDMWTVPAGGGCEGPGVEFSVSGLDVDMKPLNACTGTGATMAQWSTWIITASVVISGAFAVVRILGAGLGWNPGLGGGGQP